MQDGIAQGFEVFGTLAKVKIAVSLLVMGSIYPVANHFGLSGVLCVILGGLIVKMLILRSVITRSKAEAQIPSVGSGVSFRALVSDFAFPSMAVSLVIGFVTWLGMFMLSKQPAGFEGVAIVNTGLQWRGPVLLLAASLGGVAVPAFSRLSARGDAATSRRLRRTLSLLNLGVGLAVAVVVISQFRSHHAALRRRLC